MFSKRQRVVKASGRRIYLDHASATPVAPEALRAVEKASETYANPGAIHRDGVEAKRLLEGSRTRIARELGCKAREIIFTSGLTEGNALAIVGAARALEAKRRTLKGTHWLTIAIEHSSVLACFSEIERMGGEVSHVLPEKSGVVRPETLSKALRPETVFVSLGWANNEIGVVQPLPDIARAIHAHEKKHKSLILLHSDAGQAPLYLAPKVHSLGVDLLSMGSGKLYGPRGIGLVYLNSRAELAALVPGGGQERGLRGGTEDPALAAGFAEALELVGRERALEARRLRKLRDDFARKFAALVPGSIVNGDLKRALPHMFNVSVPGERTGEYLVLQFDHAGVSLSTRSACREGEALSHVVAALGEGKSTKSSAALTKEERARNTLRFSLGRGTADGDVERAIRVADGVLRFEEP